MKHELTTTCAQAPLCTPLMGVLAPLTWFQFHMRLYEVRDIPALCTDVSLLLISLSCSTSQSALPFVAWSPCARKFFSFVPVLLSLVRLNVLSSLQCLLCKIAVVVGRCKSSSFQKRPVILFISSRSFCH